MEHNIAILSSLKAGDKLYVLDGKMYVDDRYVLGIRRWLTGDGRNDILKPIADTLDHYANMNPLAASSVIMHLNKVFVETYPDFKLLHDMLKMSSTKLHIGPKHVEELDFANLIRENAFTVFTKSQDYQFDPGFYLITCVGGGAGGGCGGTMYRGGGGSGNLSGKLVYVSTSTCAKIIVGQGGECGKYKTKPGDGEDTKVISDSFQVIAVGGKICRKPIWGGSGLSGGGSGTIEDGKGGDGGSGTDGFGVDTFCGGTSIKTDYVDKIFTLYHEFSFGLGGKANSGKYASGGGGGGIVISGFANVNGNNGAEGMGSKGGEGYGAGGGGGYYFEDDNIYGDGGAGAFGCVVIDKVGVNFFK